MSQRSAANTSERTKHQGANFGGFTQTYPVSGQIRGSSAHCSMLRLLLSLSLICGAAPSCVAFEKGFYGAVDPAEQNPATIRRIVDGRSIQVTVRHENPIVAEIFKTAALADRTLRCDGIDEIDIGIGNSEIIEKAGQPPRVGRTPINFKRDEVRYFLNSEKHKDLLVVWFEKSIMWTGPDNAERTLADFKHFIAEFGYKRILILGAHAFGTYVLYDSAEDKQSMLRAKEQVGKRITVVGRLNLYGKIAPILISDKIDEPIYLTDAKTTLPNGAPIVVSGELHYFPGADAPKATQRRFPIIILMLRRC